MQLLIRPIEHRAHFYFGIADLPPGTNARSSWARRALRQEFFGCVQDKRTDFRLVLYLHPHISLGPRNPLSTIMKAAFLASVSIAVVGASARTFTVGHCFWGLKLL